MFRWWKTARWWYACQSRIRTFSRDTGANFGGLVTELHAKNLLGSLKIALGLNQCLLALHHRGISLCSELTDHLGSDGNIYIFIICMELQVNFVGGRIGLLLISSNVSLKLVTSTELTISGSAKSCSENNSWAEWSKRFNRSHNGGDHNDR